MFQTKAQVEGVEKVETVEGGTEVRKRVFYVFYFRL
jgi:hypothetical protein